MKKFSSLNLTLLALCITINYIGSNIALFLKLPIYLDTIGTLISSLFIGPIFGIITAISTAILSWITTDIYSIYYSPAAILIALLSGILFKNINKINIKNFYKTIILSVPSTILAAIITTILFNGITSSGSSIIVQILRGVGINLTTSIIIVQLFTDYIDKLLSLLIALAIVRRLRKGIR